MNKIGNALSRVTGIMRDQFSGTLPDTATIQTRGTTQNTTGTTTSTYTSGATLSCKLASADMTRLTEQERIIAEKWQAKAIYKISFANDANVSAGQRAVINGRIFNIVSAGKDEGFGARLLCLAVELPNGA